MVACRKTMVSAVKRLPWRKSADGEYTHRHKRTRLTANSRVQVVAVTLNEPWCGATRVVVCNIHLHHLTAKKETGFAHGHLQFWEELASTIVQHRVRILAGDFNMSLWVVARELRKRGVQTHFAAAYAWVDVGSGEARSDSCGIFLIGPVVSSRPLWGPHVFLAHPHGADELPTFLKGQGYKLGSFLPKGAVAGVEVALAENFAPSMEGRRTRDWEVLPPAVQKEVGVEKFDPNQLLFRAGAHMPLLVFLGGKGRRTPESIQRRETKARARGWGARAAHMGAQSQGDARWPAGAEHHRDRGRGRGHRGGWLGTVAVPRWLGRVAPRRWGTAAVPQWQQHGQSRKGTVAVPQSRMEHLEAVAGKQRPAGD